jgi:hypothetical protein
VNEPAATAIADLAATRVVGYRHSGAGTSSGPRRRDTIYDRTYEPRRLRDSLAYAELQLAVTPTGHGTAAIAVFGQAVPRPPRPAKEYVPRSVHKAIVTKVRGVQDRHPRMRTVHGRRARALVAGFNSLLANAPGESSCGNDHGQRETATFRSPGHVWTASIGACFGVSVVRDGQNLPYLDNNGRFSHGLQRAWRQHG